MSTQHNPIYLQNSIDQLFQELIPESFNQKNISDNKLENISTNKNTNQNSNSNKKFNKNQSNRPKSLNADSLQEQKLKTRIKKTEVNLSKNENINQIPGEKIKSRNLSQSVNEINIRDEVMDVILKLENISRNRENDDTSPSRRSTIDQWAYQEEGISETASQNSQIYENTNNQNINLKGNDVSSIRANIPVHSSTSKSEIQPRQLIQNLREDSQSNLQPLAFREQLSPELLAYFQKRMKESGIQLPTSNRNKRPQTAQGSFSQSSRREPKESILLNDLINENRSVTPSPSNSKRSSLNPSYRGRKKIPVEDSIPSSFGNRTTLQKVYEDARKMKYDPNAPEYIKNTLQFPVRSAKKIKVVKKRKKIKGHVAEEDIFRGFNISTKSKSMTIGGRFPKEDRSKHMFWKQWGSNNPAPDTYDVTPAERQYLQRRPGSAFFGTEKRSQYDKLLLENSLNVPGPQYFPQFTQIYPHTFEVTMKQTIPVVKVRRDNDQLDYMRESFGMTSRSTSRKKKREKENLASTWNSELSARSLGKSTRTSEDYSRYYTADSDTSF